MTALRLQHASVPVPPGMVDACAGFYTGVLGMRRVRNPAGLAWFEFGDGDQVHLLEGEGGGRSGAHLAVVVDDLAATLARARDAGADPRPGRDLWGEDRWFVRDPAGNLVELFAVPPPPS